MKSTTNTAIAIIAAMTIIDIAYTTYGAFYGGGGAELNPIFNWATDPVTFVAIVIAGKIIGIGAILCILNYIGSRDLSLYNHISKFTCAMYGCMLIAVIALNVDFVLSGG